MGKFIKSIVAGICALSMATWGVPVWAAVDRVETISISVSISGSTSLSVSYLDSATGATGAGTLGFALSGLSVDPTSPSVWRVADECLLVSYSSNYAWGLRVVTDNQDVVDSRLATAGATAIDVNGDGSINILDYVAPALANIDGDATPTYDDYLYSGMLSVGDIDAVIAAQSSADPIVPEDDQDSSVRATLAWQGYDEFSTSTSPYLVAANAPTASIVASGSGTAIDDTNVGSCWDPSFDDWHYIGDKNDIDTDTTDGDDDSFSEEIFTGSSTSLTYPIVAFGSAGSNGYLVPATGGNTTGDPGDYPMGDSDIVIFLAARFASTNWNPSGDPFPYVLEPDDYTTSLYVELIHE